MGASSISGRECGSCLVETVTVSWFVWEGVGPAFGEVRSRYRGGDGWRGKAGEEVCLMRRRFEGGLVSEGSERNEEVGRSALNA